MVHAAFDIVLLLGMLALGWILFAAWLVMLVVRGAWQGVRYLARGGRPLATKSVNSLRCGRLRCRALNPPDANYCRRCGSPLVSSSPPRRGQRRAIWSVS